MSVVRLSDYRKPKPAPRVPRKVVSIETFLLWNIVVIGTLLALTMWAMFGGDA